MASVVVVTPPDALVDADTAKLWAPALAADDNDRIDALLLAVQAEIEPPSWLGSSLGEQVLELRAPCFDGIGCAPLPYGPVKEGGIVSVKYDDADDVEQTVDTDVYRLTDAGTVSARLALKRGQAWPSGSNVRVQYTAGYDADDPALLPAKHAIVLAASDLRSMATRDLALRSVDVDGVGSRTYTVSDAASTVIKGATDRLLSRYRVFAV